MKALSILTTLLAAVAKAQIMKAYSDRECKTLVGQYTCKDNWGKCFQFPTGVNSYEIIDKQGANCGRAGDGIYNSFVLYSQPGCNGAHCNAGGGRAGCEPHGCLVTYDDHAELPGRPSTYFHCYQDFNEGGVP